MGRCIFSNHNNTVVLILMIIVSFCSSAEETTLNEHTSLDDGVANIEASTKGNSDIDDFNAPTSVNGKVEDNTSEDLHKLSNTSLKGEENKLNKNLSDSHDDNLPLENHNSTSIANNTYTSDNITTFLNTTDSAQGNKTSNGSSKPRIRWPCNPLSNSSISQFLRKSNESTLNFTSVLIINNETTLGHLISAMNRTKVCGLLLFYSPYCEFCTALAPLYNAVGRSFSEILIMAADAQNVMGISARYGIVGIPTVLLFHNGKAVAKYNRSTTAADFQYFIKHLTGIEPTIPLNVTSDDRIGPLPSVLKESRDYYLIFSICFLVFLFLKSLSPYLKHFASNCFEWLKKTFKREKED